MSPTRHAINEDPNHDGWIDKDLALIKCSCTDGYPVVQVANPRPRNRAERRASRGAQPIETRILIHTPRCIAENQESFDGTIIYRLGTNGLIAVPTEASP